MAASITERPKAYVTGKNPVLFKLSATQPVNTSNYRVQLEVQYQVNSTFTAIGDPIEIYPLNDECLFNVSGRLQAVMDSDIKKDNALLTYDKKNNLVRYRVRYREAYKNSGGTEQTGSWTIDSVQEQRALNGKVKPGESQDFVSDHVKWLTNHETISYKKDLEGVVSFIGGTVSKDEFRINYSLRGYNDQVLHSEAKQETGITEAGGVWNLDLKLLYAEFEAQITTAVESVVVTIGSYSGGSLLNTSEELRIYLDCEGKELRFKNSLGGYNTIYIHRDLRAGFNRMEEDVYSQNLLDMTEDTNSERVYFTEGRETMSVIYRFRGENLDAVYDLFNSQNIEVNMDGWKKVRIEPGNINYRHGDNYGTANFNLLFTKW